jgi:hypothetical protein
MGDYMMQPAEGRSVLEGLGQPTSISEIPEVDQDLIDFVNSPSTTSPTDEVPREEDSAPATPQQAPVQEAPPAPPEFPNGNPFEMAPAPENPFESVGMRQTGSRGSGSNFIPFDSVNPNDIASEYPLPPAPGPNATFDQISRYQAAYKMATDARQAAYAQAGIGNKYREMVNENLNNQIPELPDNPTNAQRGTFRDAKKNYDARVKALTGPGSSQFVQDYSKEFGEDPAKLDDLSLKKWYDKWYYNRARNTMAKSEKPRHPKGMVPIYGRNGLEGYKSREDMKKEMGGKSVKWNNEPDNELLTEQGPFVPATGSSALSMIQPTAPVFPPEPQKIPNQPISRRANTEGISRSIDDEIMSYNPPMGEYKPSPKPQRSSSPPSLPNAAPEPEDEEKKKKEKEFLDYLDVPQMITDGLGLKPTYPFF